MIPIPQDKSGLSCQPEPQPIGTTYCTAGFERLAVKTGAGSVSHEQVVLVHGLGAPKLAMSAMGWKLQNMGYQVYNWGYRSTRAEVQCHARQLEGVLEQFSREPDVATIHLVTHSMGGIVARVALASQTFPKLGRMVMLAPPNAGSHAARKLAPVLGWLWKPLSQLSDDPQSFVNQLPHFRHRNDIAFAIIESATDAVICSSSVRLAGQCDHRVIGSRHGTLPWNAEAIRCTANFLKHGILMG
jgi:pimeloyl-ACP methyl ester carboxylesterase